MAAGEDECYNHTDNLNGHHDKNKVFTNNINDIGDDADNEYSAVRSSGSLPNLNDVETKASDVFLHNYFPKQEATLAHRQNLQQARSAVSTSTSSFSSENLSDIEDEKRSRKPSAVDGLLFEIYERYHSRDLGRCTDSDVTECSVTSGSFYLTSGLENDENRTKLDQAYLHNQDVDELKRIIKEMRRTTLSLSSKLVRLLKQRDKNAQKLQQNFDVLTAALQAVSLKRRVDTRIRFSFMPRSGKKGFKQWHDAFRAIARLNSGLPGEWRKRTWLCLPEYFLRDVDWEKTKNICFNDRKNPDDDELDSQIVKDLHRTGCSWFFERDTAEDRASLKRVLLAYARWNKNVGYCQGFNVIAALILQVIDGNEEDALKVMIYLVDYILPQNYFSNNLRALSVDMVVLRDLMAMRLPQLSAHLDQLQKESMAKEEGRNTGTSYEPPLINVFTMQWFLTVFSTCLPRDTVLRIWDAVLLEGSEVLLRVALAIWAKLGDYLEGVDNASDFYVKMGSLLQRMMDEEFMDVQKLMQAVYTMAPFPFPAIHELREKYTYNITPFSKVEYGKSTPGVSKKRKEHSITNGSSSESWSAKQTLDETHNTESKSPSNIKPKTSEKSNKPPNRKQLNISKLASQYDDMRQLQQNAMLVFNAFTPKSPPANPSTSHALNHLFLDVVKQPASGVDTTRHSQNVQFQRNATVPALSRAEKHRPGVKIKSPVSGPKSVSGGIHSTPVMTLTVHALESISEDGGKVVDVSEDSQDSDEASHTPVVTHTSRSGSTTSNTLNNQPLKIPPLFKADRQSMYPNNFTPFPKRAQQPRSKLLAGKI